MNKKIFFITLILSILILALILILFIVAFKPKVDDKDNEPIVNDAIKIEFQVEESFDPGCSWFRVTCDDYENEKILVEYLEDNKLYKNFIVRFYDNVGTLVEELYPESFGSHGRINFSSSIVLGEVYRVKVIFKSSVNEKIIESEFFDFCNKSYTDSQKKIPYNYRFILKVIDLRG